MEQQEFEDLIADEDKAIDGHITWKVCDDHPDSVEFRVDVATTGGHLVEVHGSYNRRIHKLSYVLLHRKYGRIYALDLGRDHRNPDGTSVGELHKHRWTQAYGINEAYVPLDITEPATNPVGVWKQFCTEAKLVHKGTMNDPPALQLQLTRT
jgi:hypothetical protein